MKKIILGALALLMATSVPTLSQTYRTQGREIRQENRIVRGAVRGDLTPRETRKLLRQQRRIDRSQTRAARDGYISPRERRRLERQQDRASRNIRRKIDNSRYGF